MKSLNITILSIFVFLLGAICSFLLVKQCQREDDSSHSHVIAYQIERMNKMVVAEQNYSDIYTYQSKRSLPGFEQFYSADKKITMLINAKAQATYDLSQMDIELDSVNRKIILKSIPEVNIEVFPDVQFHDLDQSMFNKFDKDELNKVKNNGVAHIKKIVNETELKKQAHEQLILNLGEIYNIARLHNWEVIDETPFAEELKSFKDRAK